MPVGLGSLVVVACLEVRSLELGCLDDFLPILSIGLMVLMHLTVFELLAKSVSLMRLILCNHR